MTPENQRLVKADRIKQKLNYPLELIGWKSGSGLPVIAVKCVTWMTSNRALDKVTTVMLLQKQGGNAVY